MLILRRYVIISETCNSRILRNDFYISSKDRNRAFLNKGRFSLFVFFCMRACVFIEISYISPVAPVHVSRNKCGMSEMQTTNAARGSIK